MKVLVDLGNLNEDELLMAIKHLSMAKSNAYGRVLFTFAKSQLTDIEPTFHEPHEKLKAMYKNNVDTDR